MLHILNNISLVNSFPLKERYSSQLMFISKFQCVLLAYVFVYINAIL